MIETSTRRAGLPLTAGLNLLKIPQECWRPFDADNGRRSERTGERELECLDASIRFASRPEWVPVRLRDFSLSGFGVYCLPGSLSDHVPAQNEKLEFRLAGPGNATHVIPCEVRHAPCGSDGGRLGLMRLDLGAQGREADPTRPGRHLLAPAMRIPARIANPVLFREWGEATLMGFGIGNEWIFESCDASLLLLKDMSLDIHFDLPMRVPGHCQGEIIWTRLDSGTRIHFGVRWIRMPFEVSNAVGEHLFQTGGCRPAELRPYGVHLRKFRRQLRFSVVATREDYAQVLDLRREAYVAAGKVSRSAAPEALASKFDSNSRILGAYREDELVACLGLTFPADEKSPLRSESHFPGGRYPFAVPPKTALVEAHSLCTRSEYRGGDLLRGLFEQVARCLLLSDRDWIITMTTRELWPLYRKVGFRRIGKPVAVEFLGGLEHYLILLHRSSFLYGRRMTPLAWNYFFGDLVTDLLKRRYIDVPAHQAFLAKAMSLFGRLTRSWSDKRLESEFRGFLNRKT